MVVANNTYGPTKELFLSVLDNTEVGVAVVDLDGRAQYLNASARRLLDSVDEMPTWATPQLLQMLERIRSTQSQAVEKWVHGDMVLRVRARPLDDGNPLAVLEITVAHSGAGQSVAEHLARGLELSMTDSRLLTLLWRGLSNEEIAQTLGIRVGGGGSIREVRVFTRSRAARVPVSTWNHSPSKRIPVNQPVSVDDSVRAESHR